MAKGKVPNLEDMIRAAAANGELTYLSLAPTAGKGPGGIGWAAVYSPATKWGHGFGRHESDPVMAIKLAMIDDRLGKVVKDLNKTLIAEAAKGNMAAADAATKIGGFVDDSDLLGE